MRPLSRDVLMLVQNASVPRDRRVWQEATSLTRAAYDVTVVCPRGDPPEDAPYERRDNVDIHRYAPRPADGTTTGYVHEYASAGWEISRLVRRLSRLRRFAIVHAANPPDFLLLAALPLKLSGARFVFDQHDLVPELYRTRFGAKASLLPALAAVLERASYVVADVVLTPNESYRAIALDRGRKHADDVFVVRNGPDETFLGAATPNAALKRGVQHLIAYAGVMAPQDGVDHALRALALLRERRADWRAVFAGDGDSMPQLRRLASELDLDEHVEFAGYLVRDQVRELLATADLCLSPEPSNPLNDVSSMIKIVEYMAMGRPIVAFDLRESRTSAEGAAVYAPPGDVRLFAQLIDELLSDRALRDRLGAAGRARVEQQLSWSKSEVELLRAYRRALDPRRTGRTATPAPA